MNKSIFGVVGFVLGAAAGSLVTWKLIEKKYMDMADEEIQSVKEMYRKREHVTNDEVRDISRRYVEEERDENSNQPATTIVEMNLKEDGSAEYKLSDGFVLSGMPPSEILTRYQSTDEKPDYTAYSQAKQTEPTAKPAEPEVKHDDPYIIDPTEFGEFSEYEQRELTYYKDGIVCENDTDIVDQNDIFGNLDVGDHFGEYENDRVFVRDDKRQVDYEILRDERTFMEVL